jgi:Response regulators consisting of a CheY-like receiver domain and a winged-helix DNA-binding domain
VAHPDRPFSSKQLTALAWNNARLSDAQVRTYMMRLRKRLDDIGLGTHLRAVKRRGYKLEVPTGS